MQDIRTNSSSQDTTNSNGPKVCEFGVPTWRAVLSLVQYAELTICVLIPCECCFHYIECILDYNGFVTREESNNNNTQHTLCNQRENLMSYVTTCSEEMEI